MVTQSPVGGTTSLPDYLQKRKPNVPATKPTMPQSGVTSAPGAVQPTAPGMMPQVPGSPNSVGSQAKPIIPPAPPPTLGTGMATSFHGLTPEQMERRRQGLPDLPSGLPRKLPNLYQMLGIDPNSQEYKAALARQQQNPNAPLTASGASPWPGVTPPKPGAPSAGVPSPYPGVTPPKAAPKPNVEPGKPPAAPAAPSAPPAPAPQTSPAPAPLPAPTPQPGFTGQSAPGAAISMENFRGVLERLLGGQGRYNNDLISSMRQESTNRLDDIRRREEDRAKADAAARGVYHGTPLTNSMGDISERYVRGMASAETDLQRYIADANAADQQNAIENIFQYGQGELQNQQTQASILSILAQLGMQGGPTVAGAASDFGNLPMPQGGDMSAVYQLLGQIYGTGSPTKAIIN